jgi:cell division protein FtsX
MSRGVLRLLIGSEVRRSWRALLGLGLIVAVVGSVVLAAAAGARRTATVVERARDATAATELRMQVDADQAVVHEVADALVASGEVEELARVRAFPVDAGGDYDLTLLGDPDGRLGRTIDRPVDVEGSLPSGPDEVALNEFAAEQLDVAVGDTVSTGTFAADDIEAIMFGEQFPGFNGPALDLRVVGIARSLQDLQGGDTSAGPTGLVTGAFFDEHPDVGTFPEVFAVRLVDGASAGAVEDLAIEVAGDSEVEVEASQETYGESVDRAVDVLTAGLVVFTAVAALAGLLVVGQAVARQVQASSVDEELLRSLGVTRRARMLAVGIPAVTAAGTGAALGALGATLASPLFPIGLARSAEAEPGLRADPLLVVGGAVVLAAVVGAFVLLWALRQPRVVDAERRARILAGLSAPLGRPVPLIGTRLALDPGRGRRSVPIRSAVVGAAVGVVGVVGVGVVVTSLATLVDEPARWGWTWSSSPDVEDADLLRREGPDDERLEGAAFLDQARVDLGEVEVTGFALEQVRGEVALAVRRGRAPTSAGEIALGHGTAEDLGLSVGDTVDAVRADGSGTTELVITGEVVVPLSDNASPGEGALLTPAGMEQVRGSDGFESLLLSYPPGADVPALEADLAEDYGLEFSAYSRPVVTGEVSNLDGVRTLTRTLGFFFAVLALVGRAHALAVSSRRRRSDFAVLRALGMRRREVRRSVALQAVVITLLGAVIGVPVGLVVGRHRWRVMVEGVGVVDDPANPWSVLATIVPAVLVLAVVVAAVPAWRSSRRRPATVLRAE